MFTTVLEDTYDVHLSIVEMLHKRVINILTGSDYLAYSNLLFFYTKILTLKDLNEFLLFMYSIKNKDIFIASNNPYPTRYSDDPILNVYRLILTVHYAAARLWRSLPIHLRSIKSYQTVKTKHDIPFH